MASRILLPALLAIVLVTTTDVCHGFTVPAVSVSSTATKTQLAVDLKNIDVSNIPDVVISDEERGFLDELKGLCEERNIPFENVKNCRDLASPTGSVVQPNRLFRMGRLSDATEKDIELLQQELKIKTIVDLRSPTELKDDETLHREQVFGDFVDIVWKEGRRGRDGCIKEMSEGDDVIQASRRRPNLGKFFKRRAAAAAAAAEGIDEDNQDDDGVVSSIEEDLDEDDEKILEEIVAALEGTDVDQDDSGEGVTAGLDDDDDDCEYDDEDCDDCDVGSIPAGPAAMQQDRQERHFVSLMNEFKYVRGTVSKVRKRDIARSILKSPGALLSRRVRSSVKKPFLQKINDGGLPMLNELLLRYGAPGIKYVLEICAEKERHPVVFHCTAGKDRTGMITAIILSLLGVPDEAIVQDYSLSANVYAEMNDHKAMVGALSQRSLDAKTFLGAPPDVMRDTLAAIREDYGSVEGYLEWIGFGKKNQEKLKKALLE